MTLCRRRSVKLALTALASLAAAACAVGYGGPDGYYDSDAGYVGGYYEPWGYEYGGWGGGYYVGPPRGHFDHDHGHFDHGHFGHGGGHFGHGGHPGHGPRAAPSIPRRPRGR